MNKNLISVTLLSALALLPSVLSQNSFAGCTQCPVNCRACSFTAGGFQIGRASDGYTIDSFNGICYPTCQSNEAYDPNQQFCVSCGFGCASCIYNPITGGVQVTSAQSGYRLDSAVNRCYTCGTSQYYDPWRHECFQCPDGCLDCNWEQIDSYLYQVRISKARNGYSINEETNTCLLSCPDGQYYDANINVCQNCPYNCATCVQGINGVTIINPVKGFSIDVTTQTCYKSCTEASSYYDTVGQTCRNCPSNCRSCQLVFGALEITQATRGYLIDNVNSVCYEPCADTQYYDYSRMSCIRCPTNCRSCEYNTLTNSLIITAASSGYAIDNFNGECYKTCNNNQYYRAL